MPARAPSLDDEIRDLYRGPLGDFTAGRQALAKRLRQDKDPREAEVKELGKPPLSAWAVNQLFAREAKGMAALVGAGERARAAQRRVVTGGEAGPLRQAIETVRGEVERLAERGAALLAAAERAPGAAIAERLRANLEALALNPAATAVAARGWLDEDLEPPGFEVLAGLQLAASGGRPAAAAKRREAPAEAPPAKSGKKATVHGFDAGRRAAVERREREDAARRERVDRARAELAGAEAEVERGRRENERAERTAAESERRAAEAERRAAQERARAETSRREVAEAAERLTRARDAVARAREALTRAERS